MLVALSIRDIVLIDKLDLTFGEGLTIFTGETGAGKSIILDSLSLALGARGEGGLVRAGAPLASVFASFDLTPGHPAAALLEQNDLEEDGALVLRRVQFSDGKTKAFVNSRPVSTGLLRQIGRTLVEIHGQHDERALLDPASHRYLLDQFGGLLPLAKTVAQFWETWRNCNAEAGRLQAELELAERERDYLTASCDELNALAPQPGEEETLAAKRQTILASARIRADLEAALDVLSTPNFPASKLSAALRRLERQPHLPDGLKPVLAALERVMIEADDARTLVETQLRATGEDDAETIEERLFKLRAVARKHRVAVGELATLHRRFLGDLSRLDMDEEHLEAARKKTAAAAEAYDGAACELTGGRAAAAAKLDRAVQKELKPLRLEKARFVTHTEKIAAGPDYIAGSPGGRESIMFHVQTNPGAKPGPLMKVASGGELARFLLALKVVLAERNTVPVLVFDEIDTGVGGATASAIGERLLRLGRKAQVLAVTHSPQVAAHADAHYRLYKTSKGSGQNITAETCAEALDPSGRREEIARMLAGRKVTEEARAAAERLIGAKHDLV
jgi:DNA repair protein RecN (Recombination protein N)